MTFYHIHDLRHIRHYISLSVFKTIATALITSGLDYCNSPLYNIISKDITKLQCAQNCLSRVITQSPWFSHFRPLMKSLYSFPGQSCIIFKLCTIAYRTLSFREPSYLFSMLFFGTQTQIALFIWLSLVVCSQG